MGATVGAGVLEGSSHSTGRKYTVWCPDTDGTVDPVVPLAEVAERIPELPQAASVRPAIPRDTLMAIPPVAPLTSRF
ncbi:MAG TPA: hypothetical protein VFZ97_13275 [Acidimicrobiales bacterium]